MLVGSLKTRVGCMRKWNEKRKYINDPLKPEKNENSSDMKKGTIWS
jgi:hypothetical protein